MRVAFFSVRMQIGNGVDLVLHELARRLVDDYGYQVDIWTPTSDGTYDNQPYRLRKLHVYGAEWNRFLPLLEFNARTALRKLNGQLAEEGCSYDVVIPGTHPYYGAGKALKLPSVFFNFGNVPTSGFSWRGKLNWAWLDYSETWFHKPAAACVVSISHFLHDQQSHEIRRKGEVLHLGGDHYGERDEQRRRDFRAKLGIPLDDVVIGYCGRLFKNFPEYKGTHKLLELGQRMRSKAAGSHLLMCGAGCDEDGAWISGSGAIPLLNLPPEQMPEFYDSLDVYVSASRWEGFNLPILEAAWHGVPSVAYDVGAHCEHVTSVLVPNGDFDALCSAVLTLTRDSRLRQSLAKKSRERAQDFSWDAVTGRFVEILREAVQ